MIKVYEKVGDTCLGFYNGIDKISSSSKLHFIEIKKKNNNLDYFFIKFLMRRDRGAINPTVKNTNTELKIIEVTRDKTKKPIISGKYFLRFITQYEKSFYQFCL